MWENHDYLERPDFAPILSERKNGCRDGMLGGARRGRRSYAGESCAF